MAAGQHTLSSSVDPAVFPGPGRVLVEPHLIPEALGFLAAPPSTWHGGSSLQALRSPAPFEIPNVACTSPSGADCLIDLPLTLFHRK